MRKEEEAEKEVLVSAQSRVKVQTEKMKIISCRKKERQKERKKKKKERKKKRKKERK